MTLPQALGAFVAGTLLVVSVAGSLAFGDPPEPSGGSSQAADTDAAATRVDALRLRRPDGPRRPGRFAGRPPLAEKRFFPLAVWYESVLSKADVRRDKAAGINTYLELTPNSDLELVRRSGMRSVTTMTPGPGTDGYLLPDEVDMWGGPGEADWTGNWPGEGPICRPEGAECGYSVVEQMVDGVPADEFVWGQFGKGVMLWGSRSQARGFVNTEPDGVSADLYWFTDPNICGPSEAGAFLGTQDTVAAAQCRRGSNYGRGVERLRGLVQPRGSKPVWVFVELGHPFTEDSAPTILPHQIRDAAWSGLIHGARGVVYFNHSFGGRCQTQHVLRDACGARIRPTVTALNEQITGLAPLLDARFVDGLVRESGPLDVSVKLWRKRFYLIVGRKGADTARTTISLTCGAGRSAVDIRTGKRLPVRSGKVRLRVGKLQSVRILRLERGRTCGLA